MIQLFRSHAVVLLGLTLAIAAPLPAETENARLRADDARERLNVVRRAADDGLFDFAGQEAAILAAKAGFSYPDEALVIMLRCHVETGRNDEALSLFPRIEQEHSTSRHLTEGRYWYGRALLYKASQAGSSNDRRSSLNETVATLRVVVRRSTDKLLTARANLYLGMALNKLNRYAEAADNLDKALNNLPTDDRGLLCLHLSRAYQGTNRYEDAILALGGAVEAAVPLAIRRNGYYQRGEINYLLGRWEEAGKNYGMVISLNPDTGPDELDYRAHYSLGWTLAKSYEEAMDKDPANLKQAIAEMRTASMSSAPTIQQPARIKLAHLLMLAGRDNEAKTTLYSLVKSTATLQQAAYLLSEIEEKEGNIKTAISLIKKALPTARGEPATTLLIRLAELYEKSGDYNPAITALEELSKRLSRGPLAAQAAFDKARLLVMAKRPADAVAILDKIDKDPETAQFIPPEEMLFWRGRIMLSVAIESGKGSKFLTAEGHLRTYLERYPNGHYRDNAIKALITLYHAVPDNDIRRVGSAFLEKLAVESGLSAETSVEMHLARAKLKAALGDHSAAASAYKTAASLAGEKDRPILLISALEEYLEGGLVTDAAALLPTIRKNGLDPDELTRYYSVTASLEHASGRFLAAAKSFEHLAAFSKDPSRRVTALLAAAGEYLEAGKLAAADRVLSDLSPENEADRIDYHLLKARLNYAKGDAAATKESAETVLKLAKDDAKAALAGLYLGRVLRISGELEQAVDALEAAAARTTGRMHLDALIEAGEAALLGGDNARSRRLYLTAYFETMEDMANEETNRRALRGAVEASIVLAADTTDAARRSELLDGAAKLLLRYPDSGWKTQKAKRINSLR